MDAGLASGSASISVVFVLIPQMAIIDPNDCNICYHAFTNHLFDICSTDFCHSSAISYMTPAYMYAFVALELLVECTLLESSLPARCAACYPSNVAENLERHLERANSKFTDATCTSN